MVSKVGSFIMGIEEEGNGCKIILGSSRVVLTLYVQDHLDNTILM